MSILGRGNSQCKGPVREGLCVSNSPLRAAGPPPATAPVPAVPGSLARHHIASNSPPHCAGPHCRCSAVTGSSGCSQSQTPESHHPLADPKEGRENRKSGESFSVLLVSFTLSDSLKLTHIFSGDLLYRQGAQLGGLWWPRGVGWELGWEGHLRGRGYVYTCGWFTSLYNRNTML